MYGFCFLFIVRCGQPSELGPVSEATCLSRRGRAAYITSNTIPTRIDNNA